MPDAPLVSCIMPTSGRRRFVPRAIDYFLRQTYENRELVILDDGPDPVADLVPDDPRIRYERLTGRKRPLGTKRNLACEAARGDLILHWDDDDWMADWRIGHQVEALLGDGADACGLDRLLFLHPGGPKAWEYRYAGRRRPWLAGGTLCYTREAWRRHPFQAVKAGEDTRFVWSRAVRRAVALTDSSFYVALIHDGNTSPKRTRGRQWRSRPVGPVREIMGEDWRFYADAGDGSRDRGRTAGGSAARSGHAVAPAAAGASDRARNGNAVAVAPAASVRSGPAGSPRSTPRLTLVVPVHRSGAPLLQRTLLALAGQRGVPGSFEVVVVADGGDPDGTLAAVVRADRRPYPCRLVESARPHGDLPHRNHARNAGCDAAEGDLLWVVDADFILPDHAVAHALAEYDRASARRVVAVLSPCLAAIADRPSRWLDATRTAVRRDDAAALLATSRSRGVRRDQYSGFAEHHRPGEPSSAPWPQLLEGFPILPKALWRALGGFDERFVGWGGNKEELVRRVVALGQEGVVETRLLRSVLALHQPHEPDPRKAGHHQGRRDNRRRFRAILEDVRRGAPWWLEQREGAKAAVRELTENGRPTHRPAPRPAPDRPPARRVRVGVLTIGDPRKGLWRDAQTLVWALRHPPVRPGGPTDAIEVAVFSVANLQRDVERDPRRAVAGSVRDDAAGPATPDETALAAGATAAAAVPAGTAFHRWVADLDVLIGSEVWMPRTFDLARRSKTRVIYVPNLDWAHVDGDTERWVREVRASAVEVWAKTGEAAKVLTSHGVRCAPLRWSVPDPVRRDRPDPEGDAVRLLLLAGMGGWHGRRGVDIALEAFALARAEEPRLELELRSIRPLAEYVGDAPLDTPGLRIVEGLAPRGEVDAAYERARAVLYPTRFDGFGLSLLESLHAGLPVLCTDGDPMRELVEHEHDGLLVPAEHTGAVRLASRWECSTRALAEAMIRLAREPRLLRRLTCPEPGAWVARQRAFVMRVQQIVTGAATPRVVLLHSDATNAGPRLSEHFWADALRAHGYEVDAHPYAADRSVRRAALDRPHDIVLVGKAPVALLRAVRTETAAPLVMWHHDLCDATPGRLRWFREAARLCDLVAVPDDGAGVGGAVVRVLPAAKVHGDRGPGRRPRLRNGDEDEGTVGFLGRATAERAALLRRMGSRFDVRVYGPVAGWRRHRLACDAPVHGVDADDAIRACGLVLSPSARPDLHYTSNRLFHGAAAGGCVLARRFPGLDALYPADAIETYETEADAVTKAAALLADPDRRAAMRRRAEEHSFRHHTWLDRVAQLLDHAASVVGESADAPAAAVEPASAVAPAPTLWEDRARERGELSVGHHRWTRPEFDRETERIWRLVARHLRAARGPADGRLLDFGCGAGRFSVRLSEEGFEVVGADVTAAFVDLARRSAGEAFGLVRVGRQAPLPFTDGAFDVLWTAFTLQHVPDDEFGFLAAELVRVTRPGGLVTLVENTLDHTARTSRSGHMTFRRPDEYRRAFPGVEVIDRIDIEGEEHSLIMGRLRASLDPSDGPRR